VPVFTSRSSEDSLPKHPNPEPPDHGRRWPAQAVMTLAAWPVAFLTVLAISTAFGDQLAALPLALRALVLSGVLVALMVNLVMPVVGVAITRRLSPGQQRAEPEIQRPEPLEHPPADRQTSSVLNPARYR
jgi:ABC-type uncharacterized transport system permease subunit